MKRIKLLTGILAAALLLSTSFALAQEMEYEIVKTDPDEEGTKRIEIFRTVNPEMEGMMGGPGMMRGMMGGMRCPHCGMMFGRGDGMGLGRGGAMMGGPGAMMGCMGCCGHGGMMIGGMHGRLSKLACICQYEKHADMLELSDEQLASLKDIRMASRKAAIQARADIQIVELELDEILKEDMPDLTEVKAKISAIAALRKDMALARVNTLEKARKILTTEQLAKLKALKKKARAKKAETYKKTGERAKKRVLKKTEKEAGEKKIMKKKSETSESQ